MKATATRLPDVLVIETDTHSDARGYFAERWSQRLFDQLVGQPTAFVQDNHSQSQTGVLRGLHYQLRQPQGKLTRCVRGRVFDVAVDLRRSSPSLGQWVGVELSAENGRQLWVPPGFAHGYLVLEGPADFLYKTTDYYAPQDSHVLAWDDPRVGIAWPLDQLDGPPLLSERDAAASAWSHVPLFD
jgi:dTDP-4-dehydrorhamnose 3,5-epimerase